MFEELLPFITESYSLLCRCH